MRMLSGSHPAVTTRAWDCNVPIASRFWCDTSVTVRSDFPRPSLPSSRQMRVLSSHRRPFCSPPLWLTLVALTLAVGCTDPGGVTYVQSGSRWAFGISVLADVIKIAEVLVVLWGARQLWLGRGAGAQGGELSGVASGQYRPGEGWQWGARGCAAEPGPERRVAGGRASGGRLARGDQDQWREPRARAPVQCDPPGGRSARRQSSGRPRPVLVSEGRGGEDCHGTCHILRA